MLQDHKITIKNFLKEARAKLSQISDVPRIEAEALLIYAMSITKEDIYKNFEQILTENELINCWQAVDERATGKPIAYITKHKEFWSNDFFIDESVLIPRPETESLLEEIFTRFHDAEKLSLLDLGTGSGAIAISVALEKPSWVVLGVDQSLSALSVAKKNAMKYNLNNLELKQSDWFTSLDNRIYDIVVSNPPYIDKCDVHLNTDIRFEPVEALVSGDEGMEDLTNIIRRAPSKLAVQGMLIVEHGFGQSEPVKKCFMDAGFTDIQLVKDLAGLSRATLGYIGKD